MKDWTEKATVVEFSAQPPPSLPDVELLRPIGRGAAGQVWLGRNRVSQRLLAAKVIPLSATGPGIWAAREAASLVTSSSDDRLAHPNLVRISHAGQTPQVLFYLMELADDINGSAASEEPTYCPATLAARLATGPLPAEECLLRAEQLFAGLSHLHAAGLMHRDVKPANCLFVGGQLKLADFGLLARSEAVSVVGTPLYMPPDGRIDARADVYAAGLILYQMLTGLPPQAFPRCGGYLLTRRHDPAVQTMNHVLLRAADPRREARYADAGEVLTALRGARLAPLHQPRRGSRIIALAVVAAVVATGICWQAVRAPHRVNVNFVTHPFDAQIYLDGSILSGTDGTPLLTPCTADSLSARPHRLVFRKAGMPDLDVGTIDLGASNDVSANWPSSR